MALSSFLMQMPTRACKCKYKVREEEEEEEEEEGGGGAASSASQPVKRLPKFSRKTEKIVFLI